MEMPYLPIPFSPTWLQIIHFFCESLRFEPKLQGTNYCLLTTEPLVGLCYIKDKYYKKYILII